MAYKVLFDLSSAYLLTLAISLDSCCIELNTHSTACYVILNKFLNLSYACLGPFENGKGKSNFIGSVMMM